MGVLQHALPGVLGEEVALLQGQQRLGLSRGGQAARPALAVPPRRDGIIRERHIAVLTRLQDDHRSFASYSSPCSGLAMMPQGTGAVFRTADILLPFVLLHIQSCGYSRA